MPFRHSARRARRVLDPLVEFLRIEAVGGALLLAATITALALANSPLADAYQRFWQHELTVGAYGRICGTGSIKRDVDG
jgi:Na+:H+ antiporter, NhaA family